MKKTTIFLIVLMLISIMFLSGCTGSQAENVVGGGIICFVLILVGIIIFILIVAYLLGGKKTIVQTQQTAAPPVIIQQEPKETSKQSDRYCPECGRGIPFDAVLCPYCGKKFKEI